MEPLQLSLTGLSFSGTFELRITDLGLTSSCSNCSCTNVECGSNNCGGYCADDCPSGACVDSKCIDDAVNAVCTGAITLSSNSTVYGDTRTAFSIVNVPQAGACAYVYYTGLWYKYVGTGHLTTVTTCSQSTDFNTYLHVYEAGAEIPCDKALYCVDYSSYYYCGFQEKSASYLSYCALSGVVYYYYIEGPNYNRGDFQLTQSIGSTCS